MLAANPLVIEPENSTPEVPSFTIGHNLSKVTPVISYVLSTISLRIMLILSSCLLTWWTFFVCS